MCQNLNRIEYNSSYEGIALNGFLSDETTRLEAAYHKEYIKSRRLHPKVFRVLPVDITLVTIIFDICNVYFVIVLQYAHTFN